VPLLWVLWVLLLWVLWVPLLWVLLLWKVQLRQQAAEG
jgi:hypothetical protein